MKLEISTHIAKINNIEAGSAVLFPDGNMNLFLNLGKQTVQVKLYKIIKYGKQPKHRKVKIWKTKQVNA